MTLQTVPPQLCLVIETVPGARERCAAALKAAPVATLIIAAGPDASIDKKEAAALIALAHTRDIAALIENDAALAKELSADGVHLSWRDDVEAAYTTVRADLGPNAIVGVDAGHSRHGAMSLGESGADYIAFGLGAARSRAGGGSSSRSRRMVGRDFRDPRRCFRRRNRRRSLAPRRSRRRFRRRAHPFGPRPGSGIDLAVRHRARPRDKTAHGLRRHAVQSKILILLAVLGTAVGAAAVLFATGNIRLPLPAEHAATTDDAHTSLNRRSRVRTRLTKPSIRANT